MDVFVTLFLKKILQKSFYVFVMFLSFMLALKKESVFLLINFIPAKMV